MFGGIGVVIAMRYVGMCGPADAWPDARNISLCAADDAGARCRGHCHEVKTNSKE